MADPAMLQKRLLLCLYGLGTNTGLKRVSSGAGAESYPDLVYVRRRFRVGQDDQNDLLCRYLHSEALRREIQDGLNVIETWNEANSFTMLALHLLQICLVYINTLMIQRVLTEPDWTQRMLPDDLRALTPLIYAHVTSRDSLRDFSARHEPEVGHRTRCRCCLTATSTLPLVTRMFLLGLDGRSNFE
jgi:hypothetical protein